MKRIRLAMAVFGACGLAFAGHAEVPPSRPSDSSSRIFSGRVYSPSQTASEKAETEAFRDKIAKRAMSSTSTSDLLDYAAVLGQGDAFHAPDPAHALDYYEKAAELGDVIGRERVAVAYILGEGRPVDLTKGFAYATKLGEKDPVGLFSGGVDYERGITGPKDMDMAVAAYSAAAKAGSAEATDALGRMALAQGKLDEARNWFRQGVYLGSADAMDHLAVMVEAGQGGLADKPEAYWLYVNAARFGNAHARVWVDALPPSTAPLPQATLFENGKQMGITRTYGHPEHTEAMDLTALRRSLRGVNPTGALNQRVAVSATIHCYVNAGHHIDACFVAQEFPLGYGLGQMLVQIYNGHFMVSDLDAAGQPTADTVIVLAVDWGIQ